MPATAKICGLSTAATLDAAVAGGASHVGLNFYPPSPRFLSPAQAEALAARTPEHVARVGVFVDPDDAALESGVAAGRLGVIQLHHVTPARAAAVRARFGREIWAVVAVKLRADLEPARGFNGAADRILYDAKTPGGTLPGGMGVRFDWTLLEGFRHPLPWALSGGLDCANVGDAIRGTRAELVDVSSGVETAPGVKDATLIRVFLSTVASS